MELDASSARLSRFFFFTMPNHHSWMSLYLPYQLGHPLSRRAKGFTPGEPKWRLSRRRRATFNSPSFGRISASFSWCLWARVGDTSSSRACMYIDNASKSRKTQLICGHSANCPL